MKSEEPLRGRDVLSVQVGLGIYFRVVPNLQSYDPASRVSSSVDMSMSRALMLVAAAAVLAVGVAQEVEMMSQTEVGTRPAGLPGRCAPG